MLSTSANFRLLTELDRSALVKIESAALRNSAVAARILLRLSLSLAANRRRAPIEWRFERTDLGKPFISDDPENLDFSVSHAGEMVIVAVGRGVKLGVDIESTDQLVEVSLLDQFCNHAERETLRALPAPQQQRSFIRLWTEKEAYTKMLGLGHSLEFSSFALTTPQERPSDADETIIEGFYIPIDHSLYHAALALSRPDRHQTVNIQLMTAFLPGRVRQPSGAITCPTGSEERAS